MTTPRKQKSRKLTAADANPKNPRTITDEQLQRLGESLKEFGDLGGVVFNRKTKRLVGGTQRITSFAQSEAIIERELEKPDATGTVAYGYVMMHGTRFAYREVQWEEKKELAANLAANKHGGEFDFNAVAEILRQLEPEQQNNTGFSESEIAALVAKAEPEGSSFTVETPPASNAFAEGQQFRTNRAAVVMINCAENVATDPAFKMPLQALCDRFKIAFKVTFK